jgi:butyryl-CoA dehydrogenase
MFQMMNESRLMIGVCGIAQAAVAYQEALAYARERTQGRSLADRHARKPQVPIIEHADVRRMLLRQKAIVEGGVSLIATVARYVDLARCAEGEDERERARVLVDLLTPVAKSFPAERGFEANVLALQVHGGYGYSSEYLPEAWLRDQKLNSLHEGTTGIQALDLLGRKVIGQGLAGLSALGREVDRAVERASRAGVVTSWCEALKQGHAEILALASELAEIGRHHGPDAALWHASDFLDLFSVQIIAWQWLVRAAAAREGLAAGRPGESFYGGQLRTAQYWFATEVPRISLLAALCRANEESYASMPAGGF